MTNVLIKNAKLSSLKKLAGGLFCTTLQVGKFLSKIEIKTH